MSKVTTLHTIDVYRSFCEYDINHKCKPMLLRRKYVDHRDLDFAFRFIPSSSRKKSTTWPDKKKLARQNNQAKI